MVNDLAVHVVPVLGYNNKSLTRPRDLFDDLGRVHCGLVLRGVPDTCQIVRGTMGNTGEPADCPPGVESAPLQVSLGAGPRYPELPKLRAQCRLR